jgi:exopolysaccharide biosynthesis polyprenyl glycosylphosphotransferase
MPPATSFPVDLVDILRKSSTEGADGLDPVTFGQIAEGWRMMTNLGSWSFVLVVLDLSTFRTPSERQAVVERARDFTRRNWIHLVVRGWLSVHKYGILLPNASVDEGLAYVAQMQASTSLPARNMRVLGSDAASNSWIPDFPTGIAVGSISEQFSRPLSVSKRIVDFVVALVLLTAMSPVMLMIAIAIRWNSSGPVFFCQDRIGLRGRKFRIFKFRTMTADAEFLRGDLELHNEQSGMAFKMKNDPRVTRVGRLLRQTSLDELPQLFNVLRGDMSLVGPRPLPARDWRPTRGWYTLRHDVKPGITCTWQVNGRYEIPFEEWMRMDLDYVRTRTFWGDLKILAQTIPAVLRRHGAA